MKKTTKELVSVSGSVRVAIANETPDAICKSFLLLFSKKKSFLPRQVTYVPYPATDPKEPMMASMNVSVPDPMRDWVQQQIEAGHYANFSDYVRDLIRRDQIQEDERRALVAALIEGEASGVSARRIEDILAARPAAGRDRAT